MIISRSAFIFLLLVGVWLPYLSWKSSRRLGRGPIPLSRRALFTQVIVTQAILFALGIYTARDNEIDLWKLPRRPVESALLAALFFAAILLTLKLRWRSRPEEQKVRLYSMLPHDGRELAFYALVALSAGIGEEIVYRGVMTTLLTWYTHSFAIGTVICAAVFGLSHMVQGWRAAVSIFVIALVSQAVVARAGSLMPMMVVHATYDFIAGIVIPRWYVRDQRLNAEC